MKKFLRLSIMGIMMLACGTAYAEAYKTLSFPDDNKDNNQVGSYENQWEAIIGTDSWDITNFNNNNWNNWTFIKCGRKADASVASIATKFAIDKAITNVCISFQALSKTDKINSISLIVASDAEFATVDETINADLGAIASGDYVFEITKPAENKYYKLVFDLQANGSKSNGNVSIKKVTYNEGAVVPPVDITNTPETAYTIAEARKLIDAGEGLATKVYVKGYITKIKEVNTQYGNATYWLNDENAYAAETALEIFRGYYINGEQFTAEDQIKEGDEVIVYGTLTFYNGTYEFTTGSTIYSVNGITTGVESINAAEVDDLAPVYNLLGQPVSRDTKGEILVKNGKKFINK